MADADSAAPARREIRALVRVLYYALASRSVRAFYDRSARDYDRVFLEHRIHAETIASALASDGRACGGGLVLDLGCGTGLLARTLASRGHRVVGLDVSIASLAVLRRAEPSIPAVQAGAGALPFADGSFRVVACLGAWRHFPDPRPVVEEVARVLRGDGVFLLGYFPPRLGGLVRRSDGPCGRWLARGYSRCVRALGHDDAVDPEHERVTRRWLGARFAEIGDMSSGPHARVIRAARPSRPLRS